MQYVLVVFGFPLYLYVAERIASRVRRSRIDQRRAQAAYPITGNDPVGRSVIF